jgi:hypothetical protein
MRISLLLIDRCWNCKKLIFVIKSWQFKGLHIDQVDITYLHHEVGNNCIIIESKLELPKKQVYHIHNPPYQPIKVTIEREPVHKSFKPRSAYEKRMWNNNKKMPRNFKDEDEDD